MKLHSGICPFPVQDYTVKNTIPCVATMSFHLDPLPSTRSSEDFRLQFHSGRGSISTTLRSSLVTCSALVCGSVAQHQATQAGGDRGTLPLASTPAFSGTRGGGDTLVHIAMYTYIHIHIHAYQRTEGCGLQYFSAEEE